MTITAEELRKVYEEAGMAHKYKLVSRHPDAEIMTVSDMNACHEAALLAVARYVAERQRAVEPTEEMITEMVAAGGNPMDGQVLRPEMEAAYRAMQSVAPLVVSE